MRCLEGRELPTHVQAYKGQEDVIQGIYDFLSQAPNVAKYFQVGLDKNGRPNRDDITKVTPGKVLIKTRMGDSLSG